MSAHDVGQANLCSRLSEVAVESGETHGVVFLAWLNGRQEHFVMVGGQQGARNLLHFVELFRLADAAGLLTNPKLASERMHTLCALHGVDA